MKNILASALLLFLIVACGPATRITGTWIGPEKNAAGYTNIFINANTANVLQRQTVEDDMRRVLTDKGYRATTSITKMKPEFRVDREIDRNEVNEHMQQAGYDAIMTITLLDAVSEARFVPGGPMMYDPFMMGPMGMRGNFWAHQGMMGPMMMNPGFYTWDKDYFIEINLYDAKTEKLVWSAQSQTTNPASLERFSVGFAHATVDRLRKDGVLASLK